MPYPNEHSLRVNSPDKYKKFRRQNDKFGVGIDVIFGITADGKTEVQAIRFDATKFSEDEAKKWAKEHGFSGTFEPAKKMSKKYQCECIECSYKMESDKHCNELKCPECGGQMRRAERPGPGQAEKMQAKEIEYVEDIDPELTYEFDEETKEYKAMKTESGNKYPAEAYLYVPDPEKPSTWKLRIWETPSKKVTRAQLGRAAAAFSPGGFRGQKVQLPNDVKAKIKKKLISLYRELGIEDDDIPKYLFEKDIELKEYAKLYDLKDVEIFSAGRWEGKNSAKGGDKYTEEDLDEIVKAFNEIGDKIKPPLKLGHDSKQKLLQRDGYPAAGWITNLKRVGKKLVADISKIPAKIYELIKNKAYGRFSPEIIWNYKDTSSGKTYKRVLAGLALLGSDLPACDTIDDFIDLYGRNVNEIEFVYITENKNFKIRKYFNKIEEDSTMAEKIDELKQEYENKIKEYEKKVEELTNEIKELRKKIRKKEVDAFLEKAIEEGKITPAQKHFYMAMALQDAEFETDSSSEQKFVYTYKDGDEEKKIEYTNSFELVKQIIENNEKIDFSEQTRKSEYTRGKNKKENDEMSDVELAEKAEKYAKEHNVSYKEALIAVANEE